MCRKADTELAERLVLDGLETNGSAFLGFIASEVTGWTNKVRRPLLSR